MPQMLSTSMHAYIDLGVLCYCYLLLSPPLVVHVVLARRAHLRFISGHKKKHINSQCFKAVHKPSKVQGVGQLTAPIFDLFPGPDSQLNSYCFRAVHKPCECIRYLIAHKPIFDIFPGLRNHMSSQCFKAAQKHMLSQGCLIAHRTHLRFMPGPRKPYDYILFQSRLQDL